MSCAKNRPKHHHCGTTRDSNLFTSLQGGRVIVFWSCSKKIALHVHKAITHQQNVSRSVSLTIQRQNSWFLVSFTGSCSTCSQSPVKEKYHLNMKGHKRNPYFQLSITIVPAMYYLIRESYLLSFLHNHDAHKCVVFRRLPFGRFLFSWTRRQKFWMQSGKHTHLSHT